MSEKATAPTMPAMGWQLVYSAQDLEAEPLVPEPGDAEVIQLPLPTPARGWKPVTLKLTVLPTPSLADDEDDDD